MLEVPLVLKVCRRPFGHNTTTDTDVAMTFAATTGNAIWQVDLFNADGEHQVSTTGRSTKGADSKPEEGILGHALHALKASLYRMDSTLHYTGGSSGWGHVVGVKQLVSEEVRGSLLKAQCQDVFQRCSCEGAAVEAGALSCVVRNGISVEYSCR
ncbi:hypothetical protein HPB47_026793 [Ixodes persulcatus]|uniref:Uncharacterized protein n=1 Tax=Ixodes persulcatus TaxID=34615 RepID=A0AC60PXP2_IXOPE|nr:hypothetical protein HPB47_026793 [Ixodes persulcatus]